MGKNTSRNQIGLLRDIRLLFNLAQEMFLKDLQGMNRRNALDPK